jgi:serine phosphatase RsbU (regulator of sigma subunit)/pSer/pThr/pTyr-binding forkhead associated (FHA) protein
MAHFIVASGAEANRKHELTGAECVMGRLPECQIVITTGSVSRQHAKVTQTGGDFFIEDLKSRNGTFVNDRPLADQERRRLINGDRVKICDIEYVFHASVEPLSSAAAPTVTAPSGREATRQWPAGEIFEPQGVGSSTVMGRLDVSSSRLPLHVTSSPETRLQAMLEITQSLAKTLALDEVLPQVLNSCFKIFLQADRGLIVLKSDNGQLIPRWTKTRRDNQDETIRISRTIVNRVIDSKEAVLLADAANDSAFSNSQSVADLRLRSAMCAPLIDSAGKAFGVLQIDTVDQRARFKQDDLEIMSSIASQAAIAIDNAQLYDQALRQKALQRDLELAREVQKGFLPDASPDFPGYEFFHYYQPAEFVGGDYFDYIPLRDGRLAIIVADVVGHGIAAALLMAKLSAEARYSLVSEPDLSAALARLNNRITALGIEKLITMVLVVLDPRSHKLWVMSAGHMAPIVRRSSGQVEEPGDGNGGFPLGLMEDSDYEIVETTINPGELFVLYTDGINESCAPSGDQYSTDRIRAFVSKSSDSPAHLGKRLVDDVRSNMGPDAPQEDDMCLVCFGRSK